MTAIGASARGAQAVGARGFSIRWAMVSLGTAAALLALALLPLLTPFFMHPALDAAGSSAWLGVGTDEVHRLSDQSVQELAFGPGTFAFAGPAGGGFYAADEASHLRDARLVLYLFLGAASVGAAFAVGNLALSRRSVDASGRAWRAVRRGAVGLVIGVIAVGVVAAVAFEPAFELFHQIFFPGGNWAFDPRTSHMIQLYPEAFFEIAAGSLGALGIAFGAITWWIARGRSRPTEEPG
jgi:hypothetical protein